ncbi:2Fe-2S iron-sulfur cluster-binding protein [Bradyrhizobium sp. BTAi1]|uniref:2Fe-2S iron-sulfur cluster-binding protein n=1 Tax=Bradyrhizobium sp. (strain BTAi1 / ATCC BAA-1182) TaxID=288000 RepID=UPI0001519BEA|nr:2Fe-2S iron-sulfur cluster-binding protein [Bradyrhizobium sp. BTAi1]ABQ39853.1 Putative Oxidoreductase containinig multiple domains (FAD-binding / NAD-binding /2Fe-2S iron-sulfur cluster binding) [Bradyrhizobium sp. BTAi1]
MGGMMGGGCMGGGCMGGGRKEFYPSLMALPSLTPEQRQNIEAQARGWISSGTDEIARAQDALRHANAAGDTAGAEQAASRLRDALNQVKSGTTTLRSLAEGTPPQQIALDWFKGQMSLVADRHDQDVVGPLGLSWFHLITMSLVATFAAAMLAIYLVRMRRANALVDRLVSAAPAHFAAAPSLAGTTPPAPASSGGTSGPANPTTPPSPAPAGPPSSVAGFAPAGQPARTGLWKGKLRVAAIFDETPNVKTFRLRDPGGGPIPFSFAPGQFLTYSAEIDGKLVKRSYTIASSAAQTAYVETTIKREDKGIFSDYMHQKVSEGDLLDVMGPSGAFTFTGKEADSVVLIGGGVGITPLMAAIRYLDDTAWPGEIFLIYGAQTTEHFIFRSELEDRQRRMRNLHVAATMARAAGTSWMGAEGQINRDFLTQSVPDLVKRRIHLCGPPGMMQAMKKLLTEIGVPAGQIKTEAFGPALGAVPPPGLTVVSELRSPVSPQATVSAPSEANAPVTGPATALIRFSKSNKVAPLPPDKSVLEVAESVGVPIDYSCRAGICGVCKTQLIEGKVTMEVQEALTADEKAHGLILACQAKSIGNLVVES